MKPLIVSDDEDEWVGVRIPIAVNSKGEWVAFGRYDLDKKDGFPPLIDEAIINSLGAVDIHYVYARVPLHRHRVFEGEVK